MRQAEFSGPPKAKPIPSAPSDGNHLCSGLSVWKCLCKQGCIPLCSCQTSHSWAPDGRSRSWHRRAPASRRCSPGHLPVSKPRTEIIPVPRWHQERGRTSNLSCVANFRTSQSRARDPSVHLPDPLQRCCSSQGHWKRTRPRAVRPARRRSEAAGTPRRRPPSPTHPTTRIVSGRTTRCRRCATCPDSGAARGKQAPTNSQR
mmetsp:Transcript_51760/g.148384  ORF Transcript_51760/g.148384 Transcript_51760/m.148384 type:complete len:202 (+) Transcript_51760:75-680(+)